MKEVKVKGYTRRRGNKVVHVNPYNRNKPKRKGKSQQPYYRFGLKKIYIASLYYKPMDLHLIQRASQNDLPDHLTSEDLIKLEKVAKSLKSDEYMFNSPTIVKEASKAHHIIYNKLHKVYPDRYWMVND